VLPDVHAGYVGYLAWRGKLVGFPELEVPAELKGALKDKLCNFKLDRIYVQTQIISCHSWYKLIFSGYLTPGEGGSMLRGKRSIKRGYYYPGTMSSSEFTNIMTDRMDKLVRYLAWAKVRAMSASSDNSKQLTHATKVH
jgi:hypothetical protein